LDFGKTGLAETAAPVGTAAIEFESVAVKRRSREAPEYRGVDKEDFQLGESCSVTIETILLIIAGL